MAPPPLLALNDARFRIGDQVILDGASLGVGRGERLCLVGRNGAGKSTLLRLLAGEIQPDKGERFIQPGARVVTLPQEPDLSAFASVAHYVTAGLDDAHGPDDYRVQSVLEELRLDGAALPSSLSGGEARRAALAHVLVAEPDVLLLDEPTNHLDLPTIEWLETKLESWRGGYVLISHDRRFLSRLAKAVLWLDRGVVRRLDDGYEKFEAWSDAILEREETERHKLDRLIERETAWAGKSIRARRTRNEGRLRALKGLREMRRTQIAQTGRVSMEAGKAEQGGTMAIEAKGISKRFGERVIIDDFSTRILRGHRVGLIGRNGAGKTTLLRMLIGEIPPDSGTVRLGVNLTPVVIDQRRVQLDPTSTPWKTLADANDHIVVRGRPMHVMSYLREFLFRDDQARQPVSTLSGGERNRLLLAKALAAPSNLLVLDEPTNDLDADTLDLLQETLDDYDGTVLLVSHDRDFLDRLVTSTIAVEGDGTAVEYAGGYSDYLLQRPPPKDVAAGRAGTRLEILTPRVESRRKLSYKQQRALDDLPKRIETLQGEIAKLNTTLADAKLYTRDPAAFGAAMKKLTAAQAALGVAEDEWLELETLREELAS